MVTKKQIYYYPVQVGNRFEYALFEHHELCKKARYVGGTAGYLCECKNPRSCAGVQAVIADLEAEDYDIQTMRQNRGRG